MSGIQKIKIDQQIAELGVKSTPAQVKISQPRMKMRISTESSRMTIDRQSPTFKINRRKLNDESGLKSPSTLSKEFRDAGKAGAFRGTRTAKNDGNFLGDLRRSGDRVGKLAHNKTMSAMMKNKQINIGLMPQNRPEVIWDTGHMSINWSKYSVVVDWDGDYMPQLTLDPKHSVEVFMRTEPYFRVMVEEMLDPLRPGKFFDQAV